MSFEKPRRSGDKFVLPIKGGGVHSTPDGKPVKYKSKASAEKAARAIMEKDTY